jgi:DNA-binding response OmpR family regulator
MNDAPPKTKILLVDDSEMIRDLVKLTLEEHGYEVVTAASAFGVNNTLMKELPALALVDVQMPGLSGDKLAEIAINRGEACPIVLFSDRPEPELRKLASASGAAGYIRKTGDMPALVRSIEKFVKR